MRDEQQADEHQAAVAAGAAEMARAVARRTRSLERLAAELSDVASEDEAEVAGLLVAWVDHVGAGMPDHDPFGGVRADAEFWCDVATPAEIVAYTCAGLRRLGDVEMAAVTRKRLFVALWETMAEADRRAFVSRVDPTGAFRGRAA